MKGQSSISMEIRQLIEGDVLDDEYSLGIYATDASLYQIIPTLICLPKSRNDIHEIVRLAFKYQLPILARGGATSLAGQTVGQGVIIDYSKYLDNILEYNIEEGWIRVEPGITLEAINSFVAADGWHFAPDPATSNRATIGGMIANNSSGTKSIFYGKTSDHLLETKVLLADNTELIFTDLSAEEYQLKCQDSTKESTIYQGFRKLINQESKNIRDRFPKVMRRVSGYALDHFVDRENWNLSQLICGSEGTLGLIVEAKLKLTKLPKAKSLTVLHFTSRKQAVDSVADIVKHGPAAVEMLDFNILELSKKNPVCLDYHRHCIEGDPSAVLIVEFFADTAEKVDQKARSCAQQISTDHSAYAAPVFRSKTDMAKVWLLRKEGLGLIMGNPGLKKPIPFIEDCAIPLTHLSPYVEQIDKYCKSLSTEIVIYAHASVGVLHIRPFLDSRNDEDISKMKLISEKALSLVKLYGGSWSGEHGDGLVRSPKLKEFFGEEIYNAFKQVKQLFDPTNLMNPGKIVDAEDMDSHLRYGSGYKEKTWESVFKFRESGSFNAVVHNCSGIGACRKLEGGTMCPSFMATKDEEHSTRGRANALRLALSGQFKQKEMPEDRLLEVLDLCLSCKACKTECPSNVDMAKLKSEVLQKKYDRKGINRREKMIRDSAEWSRKNAGFSAGVINRIQKTGFFKRSLERMAGLDARRTLPEYSKETFVQWYRKREKKTRPGRKVLLFVDTYTNFHDVDIGKAAITFLESCGYKVEIADAGCCQRPRISNGFLRLAKKEGQITAGKLFDVAEQMPILVLEPGCASSLQSDLPDLLEGERLCESLQSRVILLDEFIWNEIQNGKLKGRFETRYPELILHGHCHQKSLYGTTGMQSIYKSISGLKSKFLDSGCCGMAGAFGYEKEHYEISRQIGELSLFPQLRDKPDAMIVANGFSCRHQISHFTGRKALHWVQTLSYSE